MQDNRVENSVIGMIDARKKRAARYEAAAARMERPDCRNCVFAKVTEGEYVVCENGRFPKWWPDKFPLYSFMRQPRGYAEECKLFEDGRGDE